MKDTLYYDGQCPLCKHEISLLKSLVEDKMDFLNIHDLEQNVSIERKAELLKRLHLKTSEGNWLTGLDATIQSWSHTPYRPLFTFLRWPIVKPMLDRLYSVWAKRRFAKRYQCNSCYKS